MFDIHLDRFGKPYLKYVKRKREPGERGLWVEVGPSHYQGIHELIRRNKELGLEVMIDEDGVYRALVLKD